MLSPIGRPPQILLPSESELSPAIDRAISLPSGTVGANQWQIGAVLTGFVRFQNDEMMLRIGDHFFTARPIPGLVENSRLMLQVARDANGASVLVPLLPLSGQALARISGAPSPVRTAPLITKGPTLATALQGLAARLELPESLAQWVLPSDKIHGAPTHASAVSLAVTLPAESPINAPVSLGGWAQAVAVSLAQSGLFFESRLKDHRPVPTMDLKRKLLAFIESHPGPESETAWAALDDLVNLQGAAALAQQAGGVCYSFLLPLPEGKGGWWVTFQQDPKTTQDFNDPAVDEDGQTSKNDRPAPWRIRLAGISLPMGEIDIRIDQMGTIGVGVTVLTPQALRVSYWDDSREDLAKRLQESGLELTRWRVIDMQGEPPPPSVGPGQLRTVRV